MCALDQPLQGEHGFRQAVMAAWLLLTAGLLQGCSSLAGSANTSQLRIVDVSPDAPAIDIYQGSGALAYNLGFGTLTSYVSIAPGTYTLATHTAGSSQQLTLGKAAILPASQYTLLVGSTANSMQQTLLKDQAAPAPAGQVALRFLNQAIHAGPLDLYLVPSSLKAKNSSPVINNFSFGANSGYFNIQAGTYSLMAFSAGVAPRLGVAPVVVGPSVTYPALSAKTLILVDQPVSAPAPTLQIVTASDFDPVGTN